jgi:predicted enzyme involved in methoxymalonyl-ACP biosynthesis
MISASINIGLDAVAFIDDRPFDREEVTYSLPELLTFDAADLESLVQRVCARSRILNVSDCGFWYGTF